MWIIRIFSTVSIIFVSLALGRPRKILVINGQRLKALGIKLPQVKNIAGSQVTFEELELIADPAIGSIKKTICTKIEDPSNSILGVLDAGTQGTSQIQVGFIHNIGIPYVRVNFVKSILLSAIDDFLTFMKFTDISFVVENEKALNDTIFLVLGQTNLRTTGTDLYNKNAAYRLQKMRPSSTNYVSWGPTTDLMTIYKKASSANLVKNDITWIFMHTDMEFDKFDQSILLKMGRFFTFDLNSCCGLNSKSKEECSCSKWSQGIDEYIANTFLDIIYASLGLLGQDLTIPTWQCSTRNEKLYTTKFMNSIESAIKAKNGFNLASLRNRGSHISLPLRINIYDKNKTHNLIVGEWQNGFKINEDFKVTKLKKIYRIGMVMGLPWAYYKYPNGTWTLDPAARKEAKLEGYFPSLLDELRERMNFNYELIINSEYGKRRKDGSWSGAISKLVSGEIDICLSNLIMTTEREEVIDFITPYIDMSGISIIIRKKKTAQSIFKFMTVLKLEVWIGTLVAVGVVTILIWMLEKFSPYSYTNAKHLYPEGGRHFSLGESLWFAVTSLTPQGGGECPKALSGRILVAAYWLFIVLMLATFTSNLAAFLTVERLEKTIQSMDELIRHPKITYTVADSTIFHQHFINMANAEKILFEKWKNLTLNSGAQTQSEYRVWDYPIQEQYFHILQVINRVGTAKTPKEGFERVEKAEEGDFAFLHDTMEVKFQFYENCNFIMVGQPIAEQPISVAVQQGSRLKKPLSKAILSLQKERYFEKLTKKYWNVAKRDLCPVLDESQGITLRSLGGIFLAALAGLALSMAVLAVEVWKQKQRKRSGEERQKSTHNKDDIIKIGPKQIRVSPMNSSLAAISNSETRTRRKSRSNFPYNFQ